MVKPSREHVVRDKAGCELAPTTKEAWKTVSSVEIVEVEIAKKRTLVRFVLLDEKGRRVVPPGRSFSYEVQLRHTQKGSKALDAIPNQEGIFELVLAPDRLPEPCELHVFIRFDNGDAEPLEAWHDDWLYRC
jgi:hypothetical protein